MCTVSVIRAERWLAVTMNRDERRHRHEAGVYEHDGVVFPVDAHAGGTWCGMNRHGLVATLLNRYEDAYDSGDISRGAIIPSVLQATSITEAIAQFDALPIERFNPFTLKLLSLDSSYVARWNGQHLHGDNLVMNEWEFASSSSLRATSIPALRAQRFEQWCNETLPSQQMPTVHTTREGWLAEDAALMDRTDVHTKSIVRMVVTPDTATLNYFDEAALAPLRNPATADASRPSAADLQAAKTIALQLNAGPPL